MIRLAGPDEVINHLGDAGYRELFQNLAKNECDICKRLFGEHSPEEFNAHALGDVEITCDIVPASPHVLLHFRGHECTDCEKCEECSNLLAEEPP
jgi:hypothetical protein